MARCDLCHSTAGEPYLDLPAPYQLWRCAVCGLVCLSPQPTAEELTRQYGQAYYTSQAASGRLAPPWQERLKEAAYRSRCGYLAPSAPVAARWRQEALRVALGWRARRRLPVRQAGRLLDVGCGNGQQAAWLRDHVPGWEVEGVEVNAFAARQAREGYGLTVHAGYLEQLNLPPDSYDMVSFWHSLEHTFSPQTTLRAAYTLLRPGGWLGIEVPNIESQEARRAGSSWYHLAVPVHLYHFSPTTLVRLVEGCGFKLLRLEAVRGSVGQLSLAQQRASAESGPARMFTYWTARTLGRFSAWGLRLYAERV